MPLGVVSDEDFQKELENSKVRINGTSVSIGPFINDNESPSESEPQSQEPVIEGEVEALPSPGRKKGDVNVPSSLRNLIAETQLLEGRKAAVDFAAEFGVSPTSVSAYTAGKTSTASQSKDSGISAFLTSRKNKISKRASRIIMDSLDHITDEKLKYTDAKDLAGIAKSLSGVIRDLTPEEGEKKEDNTKFIVYAPQLHQENYFESVELKE